MKKILFFFFIFLLNIQIVFANIISSNSTGSAKNSFLTNETVYAFNVGNLTADSKQIRIYIVNDNTTWSNGTILNDVSTGFKTPTTNSSGHLASPLQLWTTPKVGKYDLVADLNSNGIFDINTDLVDNTSETGFEVSLAPIPTLTLSVGSNSPSDHSFDLSNVSQQNVMLQLRVDAGTVEDVKINSFWLVAGGSGNDKAGIVTIRLISDENSDGKVDSLDRLLAFNNYISDDGVSQLKLESGFIVSKNKTAHLLFTYTMTNSSNPGDTYYFRIVSIEAFGSSTNEKANITGLIITSPTKTISGEKPSPQPAVCSNFKNQSSCEANSCKWCSVDNSCRSSTESCPQQCSGSISLIFQQQETASNAVVGGLTGCDKKLVQLRENSCSGKEIATCSISAGGCVISFANPTEKGDYTYTACLDKDGNGNFEGEGEKISAVLTIEEKSKPIFSFEFSSLIPIIILTIIIVVIIVLVFILWFKRKSKPQEYEYDYLKQKWS